MCATLATSIYTKFTFDKVFHKKFLTSDMHSAWGCDFQNSKRALYNLVTWSLLQGGSKFDPIQEIGQKVGRRWGLFCKTAVKSLNEYLPVATTLPTWPLDVVLVEALLMQLRKYSQMRTPCYSVNVTGFSVPLVPRLYKILGNSGACMLLTQDCLSLLTDSTAGHLASFQNPSPDERPGCACAKYFP